MEWFGNLTDDNAWHRGAFQGTMLAVFVYLAMVEQPLVWFAVPITICVMVGEYNARRKLRKHTFWKESNLLNNLQKKFIQVENESHKWKAQYLKIQRKMEKIGVD